MQFKGCPNVKLRCVPLNNKRKLIVILFQTALLMLMFEVRPAEASSPTEWTKNSTFVLSGYKWDPILYDWEFVDPPFWDWVSGEIFEYDDHNYAQWPQDGVIKLSASDPTKRDFFGRSARITYGLFLDPYPDALPTPITVSSADTLTLNAKVSNYGSSNLDHLSWTGIKFDAWFKDPLNSDRKMVIEMYFHGTSFQGVWGNELYRTIPLGRGDIDDHLIKLQAFPEYCTMTGDIPHSDFSMLAYPLYFVESTEFTIDLKGIWQRAAAYFGRSSSDELYAVALDVETGRWFALGSRPTAFAEVNEVRVTYTDQNDAGTGVDASNTFSSATSISPSAYTGMLYLSLDTNDWYQFYVSNNYLIYVEMIPPAGVDFNLELYNPSGACKAGSYKEAGYRDGIAYWADSRGYLRIRIYIYSGEGQYWFSLSIYPPGGGGCPYIFVWDGSQYVLDNNVLPTSEISNGTDVEDHYKLEQTLIPVYQGRLFSAYSLKISEFESEHSYLDQVKLLAVDHASDVKIAVTLDGEILTYNNPAVPISAIDNYGNNMLNEIRLMDGNVSDPATYFDGFAGDSIVLNFGRVSSENAKLIVRDDWKCMETCIDVQVKNSNGEWQTVTELCSPRLLVNRSRQPVALHHQGSRPLG